jgi:hypothetical protein
LAAVFLGSCSVNTTWAQKPVYSFDQLGTVLKVGDTVWVTDTQGREVKGKVRDLSASLLTLSAESLVVLQADDVRLVTRHKPRPVGSCALWGAAGGGLLILMGLGASNTGTSGAEPSDIPALVGAGAGVGAIVGAVVGAFTPAPTVVMYQAFGASTKPRLSFAPVITLRTKGVAVALAF